MAAMEVVGFSKVGADLEDDEEERQRTNRAARALYKTAEEAYFAKGSREEVLQHFERAEAAMAPLLGSGLMGLAPRELEPVLKGRLHQAVIIAHLPDYPHKWVKVKALVEDVLQFDFGNCHARWLRSLCLRGQHRVSEAVEEMKRAVEYARSQGKSTEADQWEAEISALGEPSGTRGDAMDPPSSGGAGLPGEAGRTQPAEDCSGEEARPKSAALASPAVQKGFFNRQRQKASSTTATSRPRARSVTAACVAAHPAGDDTQRARETENEQQLQQQREELAKLRQQLQDEQNQRRLDQQRLAQWHYALREEVDAIGSDFERVLASEQEQEQDSHAAEESCVALPHLEASVAEVRDLMQASRTWSEAEHQKLVDFATEVVTLREMSARELRERQDTSKQQMADVQDIVKRMGELKATAKTLRDHVRRMGDPDDQHAAAERDMQRLADAVADFHALPKAVKIAALTDDAAMLRLMVLASVLGMLFVLGLFGEAFGALSCRFVCVR